MTLANARLVNYQATLPLAQQWGGGDVASADGLRFVTPVRTLNAGPNRKYFGSDRGLTYYNFTSNQYTGFYGIAVPGTLRDSIYILEGLLEQQTSLRPLVPHGYTAGGGMPSSTHSSRAGPYTPGTFRPAWRMSTVICPRWCAW